MFLRRELMFLRRKHVFSHRKLMYSDQKHKLSRCKNTFFFRNDKKNLHYFKNKVVTINIKTCLNIVNFNQ